MLSIRVQSRDYRVTNETLDRLFGGSAWRRMNISVLQNSIRAFHSAGKLVIDGQRLRLASVSEEVEQQLRTAEEPSEILRAGFLYLGAQLAELKREFESLRESSEFNGVATTESLSRDTDADGASAGLRPAPQDPG